MSYFYSLFWVFLWANGNTSCLLPLFDDAFIHCFGFGAYIICAVHFFQYIL